MTTESVPAFAARHIGPNPDARARMLDAVGYDSLEALADAALPSRIRAEDRLAVPAADSEVAVLDELREIASQNTLVTSMIGLGYYGTHTPSVIQRGILENPSWYTAYTPYQPEISQGRLEALLNFQTMVADLTGLPVAGASLLDEATAAAEAMTLLRRSVRGSDDAVFLVEEHAFPQTLAVMATRARPLGIEILTADLCEVGTADQLTAAAGGRKVYGVLAQYPGGDGEVRDLRPLTAAAASRWASAARTPAISR